MHCRDTELKRLLGEDETEVNSKSIEVHIEKCTLCQTRLCELAGSVQLTRDALTHLRSADAIDLEFGKSCSSVSIELSSLLTADLTVDMESVDLNFLDSPSHPELLGRLGRYDVERVIGTGGMGIVLKAHDGELSRVVAIKVLAPHLANSSAARRRFSREARAAAAVLHPNILPIFNVESEGKIPYFVMQFVAGQSLQSRVDRDGPLEIPTALRIARQTASALAAAHTQGLVHRDVKPANILLEEGVDRAQLSDFGLARTVDDASLTRTGIVAGTPHYMSPEQANGEPIDARSDLFSLGCTLYFMLAARPPFRAESTMAVLNRICHHPHRPLRTVNTSVPKELSLLVDRLLAKRAIKRFESAEAVESALDRMLAAIQEGYMRIDLSSRKKRSIHRWALGISSAIVIVSLLTASYLHWPYDSNRNSVPTNPTQVQQLANPSPQALSVAQQPRIGREHNSPRPASKTFFGAMSSPNAANRSGPLPLTSVAPQFDPIQVIESDDQWKRDATELSARMERVFLEG